jgi:hypothetical protein
MGKDQDLSAEQQQLLADIEHFARSEQKASADEAAKLVRRGPEFPLIDGKMPDADRSPTNTRVSFEPPQAFESTVPGGGLLARLKQQAADLQASQNQKSGLHIQQRELISTSLQATYQYLRDLVEQLNVLKPPYPGDYFLSDQLKFDGLSWQEGRSDLRKIEGAMDHLPVERVSLRYLLAAPRSIAMDKEHPVLENLRKILMDASIKFTLDEFRNERGYVERGRFNIRREVRAGLLFLADYEAGDVRLRTLNVQRFGTAEYRLAPEVLTHDTLEEIALLVLGESNQLLRRFQRIG